MRRIICLSAAALAIGCAETSPEEDGALVPAPVNLTRQQTVLDEGPNWLVAGGPGLVELIGGTDGEPDQLTGRFALEGRPIFDAASGHGKWVVAGDGLTQPLDGDAVRLREARVALGGAAISFIESDPTGFVIGGAGGMLQRLDTEGEPTTTNVTVLNGTTLQAAAFNGSSWLVGGENGNVAVISASLAAPANPLGLPADGGEPVVAAVSDGSDFLAFSTDSSIRVSALGSPGVANLVETGIQITDARFGGGKVYIGTADGRVGIADFPEMSETPSFSFTSVLPGAAIEKLVTNGTDWVALGATGQARRFDAAGQPVGNVVDVSTTSRAITGAYFDAAESEWLLVVGEIGFVAFVDEQLAAPRTLSPVLGGAQINDASAGDGRVLVVGDDGNYQVLDDRGASLSDPGQLTGSPNLLAAEWNGDEWLVAGVGGVAQIISPDGEAVGDSRTLLDGADIQFASWSGEQWLIGGDEGKFQFVRFDGSASGPARTLAGAQTLHEARWSGIEWITVGETAAGEGIAAVIVSDPNAEPTVETLATGPLYAVDFNGIEWLVGGAGGLIQRLSAQGSPVDNPVDVLTGFDIQDMYYNGTMYIVAGEFGAVRRLGQDYLPLRTAIALLDRNEAATVLWTKPRGFAAGPCLTDELCYQGPCVGGLAAGQCCDSACEGACESCFQDDTGEADGTCAPVAAGKRPPAKPQGPADPCSRQSEATCGFTGLCDGAGECEFYGDDIQCADSLCTLGEFTPVAFCGGDGTCASDGPVDCSPYKGCNEDGCLDSCTSNEDCVEGFVCDNGACIESESGPGDDAGGSDPDEPGPGDEGCCATVSESGHASDQSLLLLTCLLGFLVARRR